MLKYYGWELSSFIYGRIILEAGVVNLGKTVSKLVVGR